MNQETPIEEIEEITPEESESDHAEADAEAQMKRISRRSFMWSVLAFGAGATGLNWLNTRRTDEGIPWPLRRALQTNESIARDFFIPTKLAPTFPKGTPTTMRANGNVGLGDSFDSAQWELNIEGLATGEALSLKMDAIKKLPRFEMITEFKCIEGWSTITQWAGARFADFAQMYPPFSINDASFDIKKPDTWPEYASLETPDGEYYVGLEMPALLHPQTLLVYEINGQPLPLEHGAPLRLLTPLKYGIKNLKRIGKIRYTRQRPRDYWAERGYDWYAGH